MLFFQWLNIIFSCFKQSPLNFIHALVPTKSNEGLNILLDVAGCLILSFDNPSDLHKICYEIWYKMLLFLVLAILEYFCIGWSTNQFCVPSPSKWLLPRK